MYVLVNNNFITTFENLEKMLIKINLKPSIPSPWPDDCSRDRSFKGTINLMALSLGKLSPSVTTAPCRFRNIKYFHYILILVGLCIFTRYA